MTFVSTYRRSTLLRLLAVGAILSVGCPLVASAASSWSPTLLVNTESFQTIDDGDGTTNLELRFGASLNEKILWNRAKGSFQFTDDLSVQGTLSGSALNVDGNATIGGTLTATGAARFKSTVNADGNITTLGRLSGSSLRISGAAEVHGALSATGSIRTDGDLTINDDAGANDATLTFGNATTNQTVKFLNSSQRFQFSKGISVIGTISGSALNIDGKATIGGSLTVTGSILTKGNLSGATISGFGLPGGGCNGASQKLNWNAATGKFECGTDESTVGNGSGNILSLHPSYPNAIYFSSGATYVGQLTASGGTAQLENSYVWTSSRGSLQDYWISVRVRLPDNFSSWDPVKPIQFRYKTGVASAANNHLTVRIKDTTGANVTLSNGGGLANTSWTTASITGPESSGTWAAKGYVTIYVKLAADSTAGANAAAGFLNLNFETTTP